MSNEFEENEDETKDLENEEVIQLGPPEDEDTDIEDDSSEDNSASDDRKKTNRNSIIHISTRDKTRNASTMLFTLVLLIVSFIFIRPTVNYTNAKDEAEKVMQILSYEYIENVRVRNMAKEKVIKDATNLLLQAREAFNDSNYDVVKQATDKVIENLNNKDSETSSNKNEEETEESVIDEKEEAQKYLNNAESLINKKKESGKKITYKIAKEAVNEASYRLKYAKESGADINSEDYKEAANCLNKAKKSLGWSLYLVYYIIYILFSILVYWLCYLLQKNTNSMKLFFMEILLGNGRYSRLTSSNDKVNKICEAYKKSFIVSGNEDYHKTRANSDLYFGVDTWLQDLNKFPLQTFLKIIPGTFIGFGILGTFIGFSVGLTEINVIDGDMQSITSGVQLLLEGLRNAFNTSIVGVVASVYLNFILIHPSLNKLDKTSKELCDYLDSKFYVTEVDAMAVLDEENNLIPFPVALNEMMVKLQNVSDNINHMGNIVGTQVTESIKSTMDETIEGTIKNEIKKFKEELNAVIETLSECSAQLQAAPQNLKEASGIISEISKEMEKVTEALDKLPEDFLAVVESIDTTSQKIVDNTDSFNHAFDVSTQTLAQTSEITSKIMESYESQVSVIETSAQQIQKVITESNQVTKNSKELLDGYSTVDEHLANIFIDINKNTEKYSSILSESLMGYFKQFQEATKDISKQFAEATIKLSEEIEKLNAGK